MFFWILKKNVKNVHSFTGHLITHPLIIQLPEVSSLLPTGKSRSPLTNIKSLAQKYGHKKLCNWELRVINAYKYP